MKRDLVVVEKNWRFVIWRLICQGNREINKLLRNRVTVARMTDFCWSEITDRQDG